MIERILNDFDIDQIANSGQCFRFHRVGDKMCIRDRSYRGKQNREVEQIPKSCPSSDCRLQPACMKSELLVIADQHAAVNTFPGLVHTARHTMRAVNTRSP